MWMRFSGQTTTVPNIMTMATARRMLVAVLFIVYYFRTTLILDTFDSSASEGGSSSSAASTIIRTSSATIQDFTNPTYSSGPYGRIAFRLHKLDDVSVNSPGKYDPVPMHQCTNASELTSTLAHRGVLDFKVSMSTDLKMLFIGDSIASQLSQAFDATILDTHYDHFKNSVKSHFHSQLKDGVDHICLTQSSPVRGGGVSAYMRHNYMISSGRLRPRGECGHGSKIWGLDVVYSLLDDQYSVNNHSTRVGSFNAAMLKIPALGWIKDIEYVTEEVIIEEVNLVAKHFGVETIIISTLTFSNNVKTLDDWKGIQTVNEMIRNLAKSWVPSARNDSLNSPRWILVQELGNFTNEMIWTNANNIGYKNISLDFSVDGWEGINSQFLLDRFQTRSKFDWPPSIPMICATRPEGTDVTSCELNRISPDGTHWCTPTVGPRYSASLACLLGCVYNGEFGYLVGVGEPIDDANMNKSVRACEDECNQRFMSLAPVDAEWMDKTLYSKASS